jgi:hypothetical protein
MTTSTQHNLWITIGDNNRVRTRVVHAKALTPHLLLLYIETSQWIDHNPHHAEYITNTESLSGYFTVVMYLKRRGGWLFKGSFELTE